MLGKAFAPSQNWCARVDKNGKHMQHATAKVGTIEKDVGGID